MTKQSIIIQQINELDKSIEGFKNREWQIADQEHFGMDVDLSKIDYKFYAKNIDGDILGIIEMNVQGDLANITTLLVNSKKRRIGVGRELMNVAERLAIAEKCKKIWLETNEGWVAEKFYNNIGYKVEAKLQRHILGQNSLIFVKFLD